MEPVSINDILRTLPALLFLAVSSLAAAAEAITVCADGCDYTSINAAIATARDGDVIQLAAETYFEGEQIDTLGKAVTLRGSLDKAGEPASVLDGAGKHRHSSVATARSRRRCLKTFEFRMDRVASAAECGTRKAA